MVYISSSIPVDTLDHHRQQDSPSLSEVVRITSRKVPAIFRREDLTEDEIEWLVMLASKFCCPIPGRSRENE